MAATARQIPVTEDDLAGGGGGAFADLEVPGDYEAVLDTVQDYDKTAQGKSRGWLFKYKVETSGGSSVTFDVYLSFNTNARWKLIEVMEAHDVNLEEGLNEIDPNSLVGDTIGTHIDFPRDDEGATTSKYREIRQFFSLAEAPDVEEGRNEPPSTPTQADIVADLQNKLDAMEARAEGAEDDIVKFGEEPAVI